MSNELPKTIKATIIAGMDYRSGANFDTEYQRGYEAGERCEECPDNASVAWHLGYGAALGILDLLSGRNVTDD